MAAPSTPAWTGASTDARGIHPTGDLDHDESSPDDARGFQDRGVGIEPAPETKAYEFGDAFHLDLRQTVMNAVARGGGSPVALQAEDFEVHTTERLASAVTVVLLDVSRSMPMRGNFVAAKKVAMALSTLIRTQFPRDTMYVVGFSGIAREISQDELP